MRKLRRKNGFTLIEMLIVVAIIAILIAVSIPLVGNSLERAREATDAANERAFKAALTIEYLNGNAEYEKIYCYDAVNGKVVKDATGLKPYGQACRTAGNAYYDHTNKYLWGSAGYTKKETTYPYNPINNFEVIMCWSKEAPTAAQVEGYNVGLTTAWWIFDKQP